jgi:hypothetical protein
MRPGSGFLFGLHRPSPPTSAPKVPSMAVGQGSRAAGLGRGGGCGLTQAESGLAAGGSDEQIGMPMALTRH